MPDQASIDRVVAEVMERSGWSRRRATRFVRKNLGRLRLGEEPPRWFPVFWRGTRTETE
jgi:hypothetical protein